MAVISNKRVLFIAPKFYNYHQHIIDFMESKNANVTFYSEDIYTALYRILNKIFPFLAKYLKQKYVDEMLHGITENLYDFVFVIRGGVLSPLVMDKLKQKLPNAKFIMYQWDSNKQSQYEDIIKYFDVIKTFDKQDAYNFNIEYLPLYYSKEYESLKHHKSEKLYDITFFGAYHSDRLTIIRFIEEFCTLNHLEFKYHLYITKMGLFRLFCLGIIKIKDIKYLKTYTVGMEEILNVYKHSLSVLDIELNIQNGLTMRTFEALGSGLKLITTNKNIINEPFYNEQNIIILDRNNFDISFDFFKNSFCDDENIKQYTFENWFYNLFRGEST
ncbi:MAG: hypothetical protein A2W82_07070 [Sulfurimonas sp. RIFCSPLOWO2_12_36_12]|uniref:hypothetical protein n=1 Tax=Sulfurimonas sp. RIFCSPLOWO2_12_36_12 TaxID=1802253 RepID=UPI0008B9410E|nr:hypothetical protein [Sulfurimonas sp. RIFCSPLOWO2_12_36_12]OHE00545.1 MAG: hypothetical protein A2W82_07070 [Sulfurimonas sp. RIFCSPLOWO2_12_36_12]